MLNLRAMLILTISVLYPCCGYSQYVLDTAFCKSIIGKECVGAIPAGSGSGIDLRDLSKNENGPLIHYWAKLRNANDAAIAIVMVRQGTCYDEKINLPESRFKANPGKLRTLWSYLSSVTLSDLLSRLSIKDLSLEAGLKGKIDAKINLAFVTTSEGFRIHDFRNMPCPGTIQARIFDSNGDPIPGENDVRTLEIR